MSKSKVEILNKLNEYKKYHRFESDSKRNKQHLKSLSAFIYDNLEDITSCDWYDMAGGFMLFCVELGGSTYCIGNDFFDDENNTIIYHNLSLKAYIELEQTGYDFSLLLQEHTTIK